MAATPAYAWAAGMFLAAAALAQDTKTDADTGLVIDEGFALVKGQCTGCHSAKLITHSGKTREGWIDSIRWMQRNQGLAALGSTEEPIVSYLAKHYPVPKPLPGAARLCQRT